MTLRVSRLLGILAIVVVAFFSLLPAGTSTNIATTPGLSPVPPSPLLLEQARRGDEHARRILERLKDKRDKGIDRVREKPPISQRLSAAGKSQLESPNASTPNTFRALAVLVEFDGKGAQTAATAFDTLTFAAPTQLGTLRNFYQAVTYGTLDVVTVNMPSTIAPDPGDTDGWVGPTGLRPYSDYVGASYGWGSPYPMNSQGLVEDVVRLIDPVVDLSQYDNDGDGQVDAFVLIHAGPGAEASGLSTDIWSHTWVTHDGPVLTKDDVSVYEYSVQPEYVSQPGDATVGVLVHEFGHILGLPDLYDTDYSSSGIGSWSAMAGGCWNGPTGWGEVPAFLDAWSRAKLGFVTPTTVTARSGSPLTVSISAATSNKAVYRLYPNNVVGSEYWLVENRQKTPGTYDAYVPGSGLAIWHVDEAKSDDTQECRILRNWSCKSAHYKVALEQADGKLDLEMARNQGDSGDLFRSGGKNSFTFTTTVNSTSYATSSNTNVGVTNISASGATMTARVYARK